MEFFGLLFILVENDQWKIYVVKYLEIRAEFYWNIIVFGWYIIMLVQSVTLN